MLSVNGSVGWIGTIWVEPAWRRRGVGMALTQATIDTAQSAGCRTLLLVATDAGRPLYEKIGFEVQTWYRILEAPGLGDEPIDPRIRPFAADDLAGMAQLSATATGEDRTHLLKAFASPETANCLVREDGALGGFVVRAPWGGGSTIAPRLEDAEAILHARRVGRGPEHRIRAGLFVENAAGLERLLATGWTEFVGSAPPDPRGPAAMAARSYLGPVQPRARLRGTRRRSTDADERRIAWSKRAVAGRRRGHGASAPLGASS